MGTGRINHYSGRGDAQQDDVQREEMMMRLQIHKGMNVVALSVLVTLALSSCRAGAEMSGTAESIPTTDTTESVSTSPVAVAQHYFDLLAAGDFDQAYEMWAPATPTRKGGRDLFESSMLAYQSFDGETQGDARVEGAAGTLYAEVPVQMTGARRGEPFTNVGLMKLQRCNDVPGCSVEDRRWRLRSIDIEE